MRKQRELQERVAFRLESEGILFEQDIAVSGLMLDFLVHTPLGRKIIIEVKAWQKETGFRSRAAHQATLLKELAGADEVLVVLGELQRSSPSEGVVTVSGLIHALKSLLRELPVPGRFGPTEPRAPAQHVFAAMPFHSNYDDVYYVAMSHAAESIGAACTRVDKEEFSRPIVAEIEGLIESSLAVIVDLSESKPNVLYESGYAHALMKPVVHICSTPLSELPFDVAQWNTLTYAAGQTYQLRSALATRLLAILREP